MLSVISCPGGTAADLERFAAAVAKRHDQGR
jgi:hypothetical protein